MDIYEATHVTYPMYDKDDILMSYFQLSKIFLSYNHPRGGEDGNRSAYTASHLPIRQLLCLQYMGRALVYMTSSPDVDRQHPLLVLISAN
eukprot:6205153-Pleurochrysis_carterae.AAC.1